MSRRRAWLGSAEPLPVPDPVTRRQLAEWAAHGDESSPAVQRVAAEFLGRYFATAERNGRRAARGRSLRIVALTLLVIAVAIAVVLA
jgi:hypothetical protein